MLLAWLLTALPAAAEFKYQAEMVGANPAESAYSWLRLTVQNQTGNKVGYRVSIRTDYREEGSMLYESQPIEAGGERVVNLAVPFLKHGTPWMSIRATDGTVGSVPVRSGSGPTSCFLNVAELQDYASEKDLDDFSMRFHGIAHGGAPPGSYRSSGYSATNRVINQVEPRLLSDNWLCYAPFRAVFVKQSMYDGLPGSVRDALMRWVDSGGYLLIHGGSDNRMSRQMCGTIQHLRENPVTLSQMPQGWMRPVGSWLGDTTWNQTGNTGTFDDTSFPFRQKEPTGRRGALALTSIFLLVAGPANYFYFRRSDRIRRLMFSLPVISILFCGVIVVYFIATQGFSRRGGTVAVTLLDEDRDAALTIARHCMYSGLYPLGGFRFAPDAGFLPLRPAGRFSMDLTRGIQLDSGIFQPTANFHYQTAIPHSTRERLVYDAASQTVVNGFEKKAVAVVVRDGANFLVGKEVAPGLKAKLERPASPPPKITDGNRISPDDQLLQALSDSGSLSEAERQFLLGRMSTFLHPGLQDETFAYAVVFRESLGGIEQPGTRMDEPGACHLLIGWKGGIEAQQAPEDKRVERTPVTPGSPTSPSSPTYRVARPSAVKKPAVITPVPTGSAPMVPTPIISPDVPALPSI